MYDRNEARRAEEDLAKPYLTEAQILQGLEDGTLSLEKAQRAFAWLERREILKHDYNDYYFGRQRNQTAEMTKEGLNRFLDFVQADRVKYWQTPHNCRIPENIKPMYQKPEMRVLKYKGPIARMQIKRAVEFARQAGLWEGDAILDFADKAGTPAGIRRWLRAGFNERRHCRPISSFVSRFFSDYDYWRMLVHDKRVNSVTKALEPYLDEIGEKCLVEVMAFADLHRMTTVRELFYSHYIYCQPYGDWFVYSHSVYWMNRVLEGLYERRRNAILNGFDPLRPDGSPADPQTVGLGDRELIESKVLNEDVNLALWIIHRSKYAEGSHSEAIDTPVLLPFVPVTQDEMRYQDKLIREKCIDFWRFRAKIKFLWSLPWRMRKWFRKGHLITQDEYRAIVDHMKKKGKEI